MKSHRVVLALAALVVVACAAELPPPVPCRNIPEGGCPRRGDVCEDPSCKAVYVCRSDGSWKLDHECPARAIDAGVIEASSDAPIDGAGPRDVNTDVPGASGGPGCEDLLAPDCSLAAASACSGSCCGCEDVFVCESGGWTLWGHCDGGTLTQD